MNKSNKALKKMSLSVYACRKCGQCGTKVTETVPYVCPVREATPGFDHFYSRGKIVIAQGLLEGKLHPDANLARAVYSCTLCGNCMDKCGAINADTGEALVDTIGIVEAMRADLLETHPEWVDDNYKALLTATRQYDNPWGVPRTVKEKWAKKLSLPRARETRTEVLLFIGCTTASTPALAPRAVKSVEILQKAGVSVSILGRDEPCCGSVQKRIGALAQAREMMEKNIGLLNDTGCNTIVALCAGCANALKNDYSQSEQKLNPRVLHLVEFLAELFKSGRLEPVKRQERKVTYHDPCHLGRHMGVYDAPRDVLNALPGIELVERTATRKNSICCGAGGGMRVFESGNFAEKIGMAAIKSAEQTGAEDLVSACPFCEMNLETAGSLSGTAMTVRDIIDLVHDSVMEKK